VKTPPALELIVAMSPQRVIGDGLKIPWRLSQDLQLFKRITMGHALVMGKNTWLSIGKALPGRKSIVVSKTVTIQDPAVSVVASIAQALAVARREAMQKVFFIGGAGIYSEALELADTLHISHVHQPASGDVYFPHFDQQKFTLTQTQPYEGFTYRRYVRNKEN